MRNSFRSCKEGHIVAHTLNGISLRHTMSFIEIWVYFEAFPYPARFVSSALTLHDTGMKKLQSEGLSGILFRFHLYATPFY